MSHFQVELSGKYQSYEGPEDKVLKRAYMAGFPSAKFHYRGQDYEYDFRRMVQINKRSGKERRIHAPNKWQQPSKPLVPKGPTTVVTVPPGAAGKTIQVPHPKSKGQMISVNVPTRAKAGQAMLVPVPPWEGAPASGGGSAGGWSTGAKVAAGGAAAVAIGGGAVGGALLGMHVAEHGLDATVDAVGDGLTDAGEAIADFGADAGEFIVDAAEDVGDFVMDLF